VTDTLTGVNNRRAFEDELHELAIRSKWYFQVFSLMIIDVDDFKLINDQYGHSVGDVILLEIVGRLNDTIRDVDILSRWGGEEFTVLMPATEKEGALTIAERCRAVICAKPFDDVAAITISIGVSSYQEEDDEEGFFERVDHAMYKSKANGKNRVTWADQETDED